MSASTRLRGYCGIGLFQPKSECNIGGALRAANCYNASIIIIQGRKLFRMSTDTPKTWRHKPVLIVDNLFDAIPYDCVPVAIEIADGSRSLTSYYHPERAFYIFGPEDGSISKEVIARCRDVVSVPTNGCMNLAATVNVVLYDRLCKQL